MNSKKIKPAIIIYSVLLLIFVFIISVGILIYGSGLNNRLTKMAIKIIPYPAAIIDYSHYITLNTVANDLASVQRFYENQDFSSLGFRVDFRTDDGQKRLKIKEKNILNKMIENIVIEKIAKEKGIILTDEYISQEVDRALAQSENPQEAKDNLMRLYGWNLETFTEKIVKPEIYKEKLAEIIINEDSKLENAKKKMGEVENELKSGKKFEEVAGKYSEGESAKDGGLVGWVSAEQMLPQIAVVALQMEKNVNSEVIQSSLGFHIIRVEDTKTENEIPMVKLRQILVRVPSLGDWLAEKENDFKINIFLKNIKWNKETQQAEFTDEEMKKFEDNLMENSAGDASVIF